MEQRRPHAGTGDRKPPRLPRRGPVCRLGRTAKATEEASLRHDDASEAGLRAGGRVDFQVHLSPARLGACKAQTGSSLSKHLLWMRIRQAIHLALGAPEPERRRGRSLSDVAAMSGFHDLPQPDRTMNAMMGVAPSTLREHSDRIQAFPAR